MKFTNFLRLRRAVEALDFNIIGKKLGELEAHLQTNGLELDPKNTAFTQEGIYYIEPESGIATKVVVYESEYVTEMSAKEKKKLDSKGYEDAATLERFGVYHLMQCNTLVEHNRNAWKKSHRMSKKQNGKFFYQIVSEKDSQSGKKQIYQEISEQKLYVCDNCLLKASCIIVGTEGQTKETFEVKQFFDVNVTQAWNSQGELSKDRGMTRDWHSQDWAEICRLRKEQMGHCCENCLDDLSNPRLREFLYVKPTDYISGKEGYIKLEATCVSCLLANEESTDESLHLSNQQYLSLRSQ